MADVSDHPVLGIELENYPLHFQDYVQKLNLPSRRENRKSHSLYLQIAAERGVFGLASFAIVIAVALRSLFPAVAGNCGNAEAAWRRASRAA